MKAFLKNLRIEGEYCDFGNNYGLAGSVGEGRQLIRFAVMAALSRVVRPPVYAPEEKVYVVSPQDVPLRPHESWEDDDEPSERYGLEVDESGFFYVVAGKLLDPGETERVSVRQVLPSLLAQLLSRFEAVYEAGKLLAEGAVEIEGTPETIRIKAGDGRLIALTQFYRLERP